MSSKRDFLRVGADPDSPMSDCVLDDGPDQVHETKLWTRLVYQEALDAGAELILLDNMTNEQMAEGVRLCEGKALTEASGGITIDTVRGIAEAGVDLISSGALTHSVKALDISLEVRPDGA